MAQFNIDPDYLNERVETALRRQKRVTRIALTAVTSGMFVLFNIIAWAVLFGEGMDALVDVSEATRDQFVGGIVGGMIMLDVGWFISVLYHVILMIMDIPGVENANRNRLTSKVMGEIVQESIRDGLIRPKRKRTVEQDERMDGEAMTIGDDGELIPDDDSTQRKQTRR